MTATQSDFWLRDNASLEVFACEHCDGVHHHQSWCLLRNPNVVSAWEAVLDPAKLSLHDVLILHALGVAWVKRMEAMPCGEAAIC